MGGSKKGGASFVVCGPPPCFFTLPRRSRFERYSRPSLSRRQPLVVLGAGVVREVMHLVATGSNRFAVHPPGGKIMKNLQLLQVFASTYVCGFFFFYVGGGIMYRSLSSCWREKCMGASSKYNSRATAAKKITCFISCCLFAHRW